MGFPLLQKTGEMCVGRQIKVLGSCWKGYMSNEEVNSQYKTIAPSVRSGKINCTEVLLEFDEYYAPLYSTK
jgi:hypothetical protein